MTPKDWKNEAFQLHLASHQFALDPLTFAISKITDEDTKKELQKGIETLHSMLDSVIGWVQTLSDENLKLTGALAESRRSKP